MKLKPGILWIEVIVVGLFIGLLTNVGGCAVGEGGYSNHPATTQPTTQPTPSQQLEHGAKVVKRVADVGAAATAGTPLQVGFEVVSLIAGGVAYVAHRLGKRRGRRVERQSSDAVINEVAGDIAAHKDNDGSFSQETMQRLLELGHAAIALTEQQKGQVTLTGDGKYIAAMSD